MEWGKILNLYAELQKNPQNKVAYRQLAEHYDKINRPNEAKAFRDLIEKRFNAHHPSAD